MRGSFLDVRRCAWLALIASQPLLVGKALAQEHGRPDRHRAEAGVHTDSTGFAPGAHLDTVTVTPGGRYAPRSELHLALMGRGYRELWTTPIRAPVLDLATFAGGLTPIRRGGSVQTRALRFRGADGREYNFRSIDKEFSPSLPEFARGTFLDWTRQDMTAASIPTAPVIASALLDSLGVLNPGPRVYVLPDDPALGEFRTEFAGALGTIEVHPDEGPNGEPLFAGAVSVSGTEELLQHLRDDLDHRVDAHAFLRARLLDLLMGDFDRHAGQWRWARYDRDGLKWWVPVPEDRDYAFVDHRGFFFSAARMAGIDRLVTFDETFPPMLTMLDNSLLLTRMLLAELSWSDWRAVVDELMSELTDARIRTAVMTLPPPHYALRGDQLTRTLLARRDRLPKAARELYMVLSEVVEVHGTSQADLVRVARHTGGEVEVQLFARERPAAPRFRRVVDPAITREIRVHLDAGDDEALVTGEGPDLTVRLIGGEGDDRFFDSSTGPTSFHDFEGENEFARGRKTYVDTRSWFEPGLVGLDPPDAGPPAATVAPSDAPAPERDLEAPAREADAGAQAHAAPHGAPAHAARPASTQNDAPGLADLLPALEPDWGESFSWFSPTADWRSNARLVIGGGPRYTRYGFRQLGYQSRFWLYGLVAPLRGRVGAEAGWDLHRSNSTRHLEVLGSVTGLEATVFHGFGNDSPGGPSDDFRVWHLIADLAALAHLRERDDSGLHVGARLEFIDPQADSGQRPDIPPDELDAALRAGAELGGYFDTRDDRVFPRSGVRFEGRGVAYPATAAGAGPFLRAESEVAAYAPLPIGVLALRAGGGAVVGDHRFYDAVFLGGTSTLRGYQHQRFAGDRAAFGAAELRVPLARANLLVRGTLGVSVFGDLGRVWEDGASPGGWHSGVGTNVWFHLPLGAVTLGYAHGEEGRWFARLGMPF